MEKKENRRPGVGKSRREKKLECGTTKRTRLVGIFSERKKGGKTEGTEMACPT
jgi:hypothetical protein